MNTYERILRVFHDVFEGSVDTNTITPASTLREDAGINSIGMLYMAMSLEAEFGIKFQNDDFLNMNTVGDVISCIESKLQ